MPAHRLGPAARRLATGLPGAFLWLLAVAVFSTWPLARFASSRVPDNLFDPLENAWIFASAAHGILHHPLHLFDANIFAPERYTLAFTENMLGLSLPVAPLYWIAHNAVLSVNVALLLILAVSGLGVVVLVREVTGSLGAGVVAGTAFTVMPYRIASAGHPHVVATHLTPWILWALIRVARPAGTPRASRRRILVVGLLLALQAWSSVNGFLATVVAVAAWAAWELARGRRQALAGLARASAGVAVGLVLTAPMLVPYVEVHLQHPEYTHPPVEARVLSATPGSFLSPPGGGPVSRPLFRVMARRFQNREAATEKALFPGIWLSLASAVAVAAAVVAAVRRRPRPGLAYAGLGLAVAAFGFLASLGPRYGGRAGGIPLPFALLQLASGGLTRAPARLGVLIALGLAITAGTVLGAVSPGRRRLLVAASLAALVLEAAPPAVRMVVPPPITAAHRALAGRRGVTLALPTGQVRPPYQILDAWSIPREAQQMYLSTATLRPITNGYAAFQPNSWWDLAGALQDFPSAGAFAALGRRDVRTLVVQTDMVQGTPWADVVARLRSWPGVRPLGAGRGVRTYDITAAAGTPPA